MKALAALNFSCFIIGDDTLTIQCADILLNGGHQIFGLVSENPEIGRWANKREVMLIDPQSDLQAALGEHSFDYLFSIANLRLLPKELVALPPSGTTNFHTGP